MKKIFLLLFLVALFLPACAGTPGGRTPVVQQHEYVVALEDVPENSQTAALPYGHPLEVDLAVLERLLRDLRYVEKGGLMSREEQGPVFQASEIERLAPALQEALAKAGPRQRIRFVSFNRAEAVLFFVTRKTEGVMFVDKDGRLNLAFNAINVNRQTDETSTLSYRYSVVDPLTIKSAQTTLVSDLPHIQAHTFETGGAAPMWIEANLSRSLTGIDESPEPSLEKPEIISPAPAPAPAPVPSVPTVQPRDLEPPSETPAPKTVGMGNDEIRNRLRFLKELQNEGLISEQDYQRKKLELLDRVD